MRLALLPDLALEIRLDVGEEEHVACLAASDSFGAKSPKTLSCVSSV